MSDKEILNFEASKKAMSKFSDDEKALLMMDMTQNLFEAHKMRHEAGQEIQKLINERDDWVNNTGKAIEEIQKLKEAVKFLIPLVECDTHQDVDRLNEIRELIKQGGVR
jgi:CRISPR/Cas system-associated protein Cas10 (large subunit of type III CRISPR-Cas system)